MADYETANSREADTTVNFKDIVDYLDAIANKAENPIDDSPHGAFWRVSYTDFKDGTVPNVKCDGMPIPFINKEHPLESSFYVILLKSFCNKRQMPGGGPFITDAGYEVTLPDGTRITGTQIADNIASWLSNGFPE